MSSNGISTTNGTALTPSEQRIVVALTRVLFERWAIERRVLEERCMQRIDERFTSLREEIEFELMELEDVMRGEGPDPDETDDEDD